MCDLCGSPTHAAVQGERGPSRRLVIAAAAAGAVGMAWTPPAPAATPSETPALGYAARSAAAPLERFAFTRRELRPDDVLIDVRYCGVCHSDIHTVRGDWGPQSYPLLPGHEVLGRVSAVGKSVTKFKVGDAAGVGCMVDSCGECEYCRRGLEQYCTKVAVFTYGMNANGENTLGGYSNRIVVKEGFVIKIPEPMFQPSTAPLLCAGITTFSPMRHWKVAPDARTGVIGLGGLGHVAVKLLSANGNAVTVFTTSPGKLDAALKLGAREAVLWTDQEAFARLAGRFDYIISTVPFMFDFNPFIALLGVDGTLVNVGAFGPITPSVDGGVLVLGRRSVAGSVIGGIAETQEVIDLCAARGIGADVELIPIDKVNEAYERVVKKDVRFRFVIDMSTLT